MGQGRQQYGQGVRCLPWLALAALSACGPVPVQQAETECLTRVQSSRTVSGDMAMGASNHGVVSRGRVTLGLGTGAQGDPSAAFDRCVYDRSGRMPTRPLYARTDWRG